MSKSTAFSGYTTQIGAEGQTPREGPEVTAFRESVARSLDQTPFTIREIHVQVDVIGELVTLRVSLKSDKVYRTSFVTKEFSLSSIGTLFRTLVGDHRITWKKVSNTHPAPRFQTPPPKTRGGIL